jgi:F0F1-type ATP synthase membrane subunit b/b'
MSALTFDTLKFANRLKTAGVPSVQAEAEADALAEVLETNLGELATKEDLRATKEDLRHEINNLRHEINDLRRDLRHEIKESAANLKFELLKWLIGLAVAQAGLLIGILKFFPINS